jgi:cytochrome b
MIFRIFWGFLGSHHSKFKNFIPTPHQLISYVKQNKQTKEPPGHNPLGSLMVVFMLTIILLQGISGLFMNDDIFTAGPYNGAINKDIETVLVFIHRNSFDFIIGAIALHIIAIIGYKKLKNRSLILPMFTGKKSSVDVSEKDAIKHSKIVLAVVIALAVTAFVYWLVVINAPVVEEYYY